MRGTPDDERVRKAVTKRVKAVVRGARLALGLTQEDVAERLGLVVEVYGRIERGGFLPRVPTLRKLAVVLKVSVDRLIGLDDAETCSALPQKALGVPENELPIETRRTLRAVRKLSAVQQKTIMTMATALADVGSKGSKRAG